MEQQLLDFLEFLKQEYHYSDNTIAAYRNDLRQFAAFVHADSPGGSSSWDNVSVEQVSDYAKYLEDRGYASSSVARKVAAIKSFFNHLASRHLIGQNPTKGVEAPKVEKRLPKTLTAAEIERLLSAPAQGTPPKSLRDEALLRLLFSTGIRVTEAVSLRVDEVMPDRNELISRLGGDVERTLPLDQAAAQSMTRYLQDGRPRMVKDQDEQALFVNHRGQQLTRQGLWLIIKAYAQQAGLAPGVTPHTLRHSFAAHQLLSGTELQDVQQMLGHANISTTQVYTQLQEPTEGS